MSYGFLCQVKIKLIIIMMMIIIIIIIMENAILHQPSKSYADIAREGKSTSLGNLNIRDIYLDLMNGESNNLSSTEITPPRLSTNSAEMQNSSNSLENSTSDSLGLTSQDRELISILDELQNISVSGPSNNTDRLLFFGNGF